MLFAFLPPVDAYSPISAIMPSCSSSPMWERTVGILKSRSLASSDFEVAGWWNRYWMIFVLVRFRFSMISMLQPFIKCLIKEV